MPLDGPAGAAEARGDQMRENVLLRERLGADVDGSEARRLAAGRAARARCSIGAALQPARALGRRSPREARARPVTRPDAKSQGASPQPSNTAARPPRASSARARRRSARLACNTPSARSSAMASRAAPPHPTSTAAELRVCRPPKMKLPRLGCPTGVLSVAMPTVHTTAVRMPARITGSASGSSTREQALPGRHPHAVGGLQRGRVHADDAGHGIAQDGQHGVEDQRGQRRPEAERAQQRHHQREQRQARDRLHHSSEPEHRRAQVRTARHASPRAGR